MLSPAVKDSEPPRWQGLCSQSAQLWATCEIVPFFEALGTPPGGRGYVASPPTCGPSLILLPFLKRWGHTDGRRDVVNLPTSGPLSILSPVVKHWGPPRLQGLCSQFAPLWSTCDLVARFEALGTPRWQGLCSQTSHLWPIVDIVPRCEGSATPADGRHYVANPPTCGPRLILLPSLKRLGPRKWQG